MDTSPSGVFTTSDRPAVSRNVGMARHSRMSTARQGAKKLAEQAPHLVLVCKRGERRKFPPQEHAGNYAVKTAVTGLKALRCWRAATRPLAREIAVQSALRLGAHRSSAYAKRTTRLFLITLDDRNQPARARHPRVSPPWCLSLVAKNEHALLNRARPKTDVGAITRGA